MKEKKEGFKIWQSKFYKSNIWVKKIRPIIIIRDNNICQRCGKLCTEKYETHIDHIKEVNEYNYNDKNITLNPNNLQVLCQKCHTKKTSIDKISIDHKLIDKINVDWSKRDEF